MKLENLLNQIDLVQAVNALLSSIPAILAIGLGWYVVHYFTSRRDRKNAERLSINSNLRDVYISFVQIGTYGLIGRNSQGKVVSHHKRFQESVAIVHLYGNEGQSNLVNELCRSLSSGEMAQFTPLIDSLRHQMRSSLGLSVHQHVCSYFKLQNLRDDKTGEEISMFD